MDPRIQELVKFTKKKFGLENYYLARHSFYRNVNIFNETDYTLSMEWFPNHVKEHGDDDSNPKGTACIEIDIKSRKFKSAIFVRGKSFAENGVQFEKLDTNEIIKWIEQETGLTYQKQFRLYKQVDREFHFRECIDDVAVSPSGYIEIKLDQGGKLTMFSSHGQFPSKEQIKEESYSLSLDSIEHFAKEQLKLVEFPSRKQKRFIPAYGIEELYITNDRAATIPFEFIVDARSYLKIDITNHWDEPINIAFERKEIRWIEDVTVEQAFSFEPSPDSFPILKEEQEKCVIAVRDFLRKEYPNDTGKWILKTLHRDKGYILATVRANHQDNCVFQRKIKVMIDAKSFQAVNYIDNKFMLESFDQFEAPDQVKITKEEAYEKMKELFELKPIYVYDFEKTQYILCGKLDCQYAVYAGNGEIISLDDL